MTYVVVFDNNSISLPGQIGSRRVVQWSGLLIMVLSIFLKFSTIFAAMPGPIIGGMFCAIFGLISAVGLSALQYVDMNSSRNLYVLGFSVFMGMVVPKWISSNQSSIKTGSETLDQILIVLLSTSMFVGGFLGCLLDNTIPGTAEERGVKKWRETQKRGSICSVHGPVDGTAEVEKCYGLPGIKSWRYGKYIPIMPNYEPSSIFKFFKRQTNYEVNRDRVIANEIALNNIPARQV